MSLVAIRSTYVRNINVMSSGSATLTPTAAAAGTTNVASTISVPGASVGDIVTVAAPSSLLNLILQGEVTAANVVTLKFANVSAGSITPPAGLYRVLCETFTSEVV